MNNFEIVEMTWQHITLGNDMARKHTAHGLEEYAFHKEMITRNYVHVTSEEK